MSHLLKDQPDGQDIPALARRAVQTFIREGLIIRYTPSQDDQFLSQPAACFVSIKTTNGDLRGCIGTIEPIFPALGEEIIHNAVQAASRDPRFLPVAETELPNLRFSVDILSQPEATQFEYLDPSIFGVIVEDENRIHRGLLLPNIEGVESPKQQVDIAACKAGIAPDIPLRLYRFRVTRFREPENYNSSQKE